MKFVAMLSLALMTFSLGVQAGPFTDDMSKCLVKNTTQEDKEALIKWIYAAMSAHPSVKALSNVSAKQGESLNKGAADLMMELLTQRCKTETQQAIKYEGEGAIRTSFQILGQVAMQDLMSHPAVTKYITGITSFVDKKSFEDAFGSKAAAPDVVTEKPAPVPEEPATEKPVKQEDK
jgi:hypothetical protein